MAINKNWVKNLSGDDRKWLKNAQITGLRISSIPDHLSEGIKKVVFDGAHGIRNHIINSMRQKKSGKDYRVPGTKRVYTASAPGESPAVALGGLMGSIKTEISQDGKSAKIGIIDVSSLEYGAYLEFGTLTVQPRPWLRPAFNANSEMIREALKKAVKDAKRGG